MNMPDPIPVWVLGRLAAHSDYQRRGLGAGMLQNAIHRCLAAASEGPAACALLCHAIDQDAKNFYLANGFEQSPVDEMTLMFNLVPLLKQLKTLR